MGCCQVKPLTEGLRLNPEADAEALAHAGVLVPLATHGLTKAQPVTTAPVVMAKQAAPAHAGLLAPLAPQGLTKAEAQPVTTSAPVTAKNQVAAQSCTHTVQHPEDIRQTPICSPVTAIPAASRQLQGLPDLVSPPTSAPVVAGTRVASTLPPATAGLAAETVPAAHVERLLPHNHATALAGNTLEDRHCMTNADQHHSIGNDAAGLSALEPGCANSKQTERGLADRAVASGRALELASIAKEEGKSGTMATAAKQDAGLGGTSGADRQTKRRKVAVSEA